jgi:glucose-1-phosphate cytidylyltransferase
MCTLTAVHPAGRYGALSLDEAGRIHTFSEKPQVEEAYISGGFMVCDYRIFGYLERSPEVMFEREPIADLVRDGELNSYRHEGFWQSMDTYQEAQYLNRLWQTGAAPWKVWSDTATAKASLPSSTVKAKK